MSAPPIPASLKASVENTKAKYVRMGTSGLRVSVPILGAMSIGHKGWADWVIEEDEALPLLKAAYDRGVNTWDTANMYSNGVSEQLIAKAMKKYEIPRQKLVIITKCYLGTGEEQGVTARWFWKEMYDSKDYVNQMGNSRQAIFNQVEASLKRLDTDYIDLLLLHRFDYNTPIEETMGALNDLVRSGKVRYIGASSMWATQFAQMQFCAEKHGWSKFVAMQNYYNLIYREEEREMNRFCKETGVGLIPWSPLAGGVLARLPEVHGDTPRSKTQGKPEGATQAIVQRVKEIADQHGWKMSHVAMAWINKRVTSPIVGFSNVERIDEALESLDKTLTEEEEKSLEELYVDRPVQGHH